MWQAWLNGVFGLWIMLVAFLGFSSTLTRGILILTGLAIAILGFWASSLTKIFPKNNESEILPEKTAPQPQSQIQSQPLIESPSISINPPQEFPKEPPQIQ